MIREFIKDWVKYLPSQIVPALVGLITIPIVTRLFTPQNYGHYVLVMATVTILTTIGGWQGFAIIRFYPAYNRDGNLSDFYGTVIRWFFISMAILTVFFLGALFAMQSLMSIQLSYFMLLGALIFILRAVLQIFLAFLRAKRRAGWYTSFLSWYYIGSISIGLAMVIFLGYGVEGLLWGYVISLAATFPLLWKFTPRRIFRGIGHSTTLAREFARYGVPLVIGQLAVWILSLSDRYIIEFFRGSYEVGLYSASYVVSEKSIHLIAFLFVLASVPIGMDVWEKKGLTYSQKFVSSITRYYLLVCIPAVVGLSILAKPIISIFTAPEYHQGFRIVPFVALGGFFLGLQYRFQTGLLLYKKTNVIMIGVIATSLISVGLNIFLVPRYGYMAAAVTTLISYAFLLTAMVFASRRYFVWNFPFRSLGKITLASAVMGIVVFMSDDYVHFSPLVNVVACAFLGAGVYCVILFVLREIHPQERQAIKKIMVKYRELIVKHLSISVARNNRKR